MRLNPEIQRNLWLEFSPHRLFAMPIVLGLILYIAGCANDNLNESHAFEMTAVTLYFLLVKIWGGHKAAEAVLQEVNDNTWDFQKLSALSPWDLTIGKLFGGSSFTWYGGLMVYVAAVWAVSNRLNGADLFCYAALMLLSGLIVQAAALFTSLIAVQNRNGAHNKMRPLPYHFAGLVIGGIFAIDNTWQSIPYKTNLQNIQHHFISWYGTAYELNSFLTITALVTLGWLVAGIYWQMRGQLKMPTSPWLWLGFVLFWIGYSGGFTPDMSGHPQYFVETRGLIPFFLSLAFLYVITFQEGWTTVRYRRCLSAWKEKHYSKAFEICPRWVLTYPICLALALWIGTTSATIFTLGFMFFATRDIAILHIFKLNPENQNPTRTTKFYLALLYLLLPALFAVLHIPDGLLLFVPSDKVASLLSGSMQAAIFINFALSRWHRFGVKAA